MWLMTVFSTMGHIYSTEMTAAVFIPSAELLIPGKVRQLVELNLLMLPLR